MNDAHSTNGTPCDPLLSVVSSGAGPFCQCNGRNVCNPDMSWFCQARADVAQRLLKAGASREGRSANGESIDSLAAMSGCDALVDVIRAPSDATKKELP